MLNFWKSEPQYAYKHYAYKKKHVARVKIRRKMVMSEKL